MSVSWQTWRENLNSYNWQRKSTAKPWRKMWIVLCKPCLLPFLFFCYSILSIFVVSLKAQQERELRQMKFELEEMKKQKVKMIRKMKEDTSIRKVTDARKERYMCVYIHTPCLTTCVQLCTPSCLSTVCPVLSSLSSPFLNLHLHVLSSQRAVQDEKGEP